MGAEAEAESRGRCLLVIHFSLSYHFYGLLLGRGDVYKDHARVVWCGSSDEYD